MIGAVGLGLDEGFFDDGGGGVGEGGEDAAGVEPADAAFEEGVEVDVAGLHVHGGGVAAVVHGDAGADAGADFGEVQADAVRRADAVIFGDERRASHPRRRRGRG